MSASTAHTIAAWLALLCCTAQTPAFAQAPAPRHQLVFRNGDRIFGTLQSFAPAAGLIWRHADAVDPIQFTPANLTEVHFADRRLPAQPTATNLCLVRLTNSDELSGNLLLLDGEKLLLDTWFAGTLTIPRARVRTLTPLSLAASTVFDGPTSLDGWTQGKSGALLGDAGEWQFVSGALFATKSASLARDLKLPPRASIEFEMAWRGTFNLAVGLYTDTLQPISLRAKENEPNFGGFYSLQLNNPVVSLLLVKKQDPLKQLGQVFVPQLAQTNRAHITIKVDKESHTIALLVNGAVVHRFVDPDGFGGEGTGVRFVHQGLGAIKLSNLRVSHWDGRVEDKSLLLPNAKVDTAILLNRDVVAGALQSIRDGRATFAIGGNVLDVPVARIAEIGLAEEKMAGAAFVLEHPLKAGNVRVQINPRGSLTFELLSWDEQRVVAHSPNFGQVNFNPQAFTRLQFHAGPP